MFARRRNDEATYYSAFDSLLAEESSGGRLGLDRLGVSVSDLPLPQTEISIVKTKNLGITVVNNPKGVGVVISKLNGVSDECGLRFGHVVTAINGVEVNAHQEAIALVNSASVGDQLNLSLLSASPISSAVIRNDRGRSVGVTLEGEQANGGVLVKSLKATGEAAASGLQVGDAIWTIDGNVPSDHAEATRMLKALKSEGEVQLLLVPARVYKAPRFSRLESRRL